ncbi:MAG TPA: nickel-dependent lactate racemase [Candidatus Limnocylindrales bacterium]|nr:nickel-dependent lactate racemase [Candidatus Limnocylindrales bacterium]
MNVQLAYGEGCLEVDLPEQQTTVIKPSFLPGLKDERRTVIEALGNPIEARPLRDWIKSGNHVCVVFTDITRATPNERLIPWLLEYLAEVPPGNITLLNALGGHRHNTAAELDEMVTPAVTRRYRVVNHEAENAAELVALGTTRDGTPALLNRRFVEADVRIVTGFIEPHFFAGFSGGPKGVMPGVAGLKTIMSNHGTSNISDPKATFGKTRGNPIWEEMRDIALRAGPSFLMNVTLNENREITGVFSGDLIGAHAVGCEFVRKSAMQKVEAPFDIVVTSNSGYPLDQNLYQGVKGMSAGARVVKPGGTVILACECRDGVPFKSSFDRILRGAASPEQILDGLARSGSCVPEQWQAQIQGLIQRTSRVLLYSSLPDEVVRAAHLVPCRNIGETVKELLSSNENGARVGVLPQGPLTIPYLS